MPENTEKREPEGSAGLSLDEIRKRLSNPQGIFLGQNEKNPPVPTTDEIPPWLEREGARLREKYLKEQKEAGKRIRTNVEARDQARREDFLSIWRLKQANRERPLREAMEKAKQQVEEAGRLAIEAQAQPPETLKTKIFNRLKNFGSTVAEFLSAPSREAERIRRFESQSHEQLAGVFKDSGRKLRGISGFLRGLGAATFAGTKEGILTGTKVFSAKMQESRNSGSSSRSGGPPGPSTF